LKEKGGKFVKEDGLYNIEKRKRKFTVQALEKCDILGLKISDVQKIRAEFQSIYDEFFVNAY
jgi:hypothetical protein